MAIAKKINQYLDLVGSIASGVCLAHCIATPILFAAHASHSLSHNNHPVWWGTIDLIFITIAAVAIFWSVKNSSAIWMKYALWVSWALLTCIILNEKLEFLHFIEEVIYIPSLGLVGLHLYNKKYCQCSKKCCESK